MWVAPTPFTQTMLVTLSCIPQHVTPHNIVGPLCKKSQESKLNKNTRRDIKVKLEKKDLSMWEYPRCPEYICTIARAGVLPVNQSILVDILRLKMADILYPNIHGRMHCFSTITFS